MSRRLSSPSRAINTLLSAFVAAVGRLDKSLSPSDTIEKLRKYPFGLSDTIYIFHILNAAFWLYLMEVPGFPLKLAIPVLYAVALLIPFTSQFFVPATPVFTWLITYYTSKFIPVSHRPPISVLLLPTLESVLYGANISDILTRFTHPVLDIAAWLPYGVLHFTLPFVVAAVLWLFRPKAVLHFWARAFGYLNLIGVLVQIAMPCAAPWYELIYGLTPADYSVHGSAGGLARIDALTHSSFYTTAFATAPVVFGAFPSLHAGCATLDVLFIAHFFPRTRVFAWAYAGLLYWATMYLTHHYLIDVVVGACLATATFYAFLPADLRDPRPPATKYALYDLEAPRRARGASPASPSPRSSGEHAHAAPAIAFRSPNPAAPAAAAAQPREQPRGHKHTASIASLIRAEDRVEDGWSPIGAAGFTFPPVPSRGEAGGGSEGRRGA